MIAAIVAIVFYARKNFYSPINATDTNVLVFEVKEGQGLADIGEGLERQGLIKSKTSFVLYSKIKKYSLSSGAYQFSKSMTVSEIAKKIANAEIAYTKVLFQEGLRREQMAQILNKKGYSDYRTFMQKTEGLEGKLFPDTYYFPMTADVDKILLDIAENYQKRTSGLTISKEALIIASLIERESANDTDRKIISSVFHNRSKIGMKFESDVTVQYQKDTANYSIGNLLDYKFWQELKYGDVKKYAGPYNSYSTLNLAGPICNPGLKSIEAALSPGASDYLYFLYGNDGKLYLAKNSAEHEVNIQKYLRN